jgi:hypothetical protein
MHIWWASLVLKWQHHSPLFEHIMSKKMDSFQKDFDTPNNRAPDLYFLSQIWIFEFPAHIGIPLSPLNAERSLLKGFSRYQPYPIWNSIGVHMKEPISRQQYSQNNKSQSGSNASDSMRLSNWSWSSYTLGSVHRFNKNQIFQNFWDRKPEPLSKRPVQHYRGSKSAAGKNIISCTLGPTEFIVSFIFYVDPIICGCSLCLHVEDYKPSPDGDESTERNLPYRSNTSIIFLYQLMRSSLGYPWSISS